MFKNENYTKIGTYIRSQKKPWIYFLVSFSWSWVFWVPAALSGRNVMQPPMVYLLLLGGLGPPIAAITLTWVEGNRDTWRQYWSRVTDCKRISLSLWIIIILYAPLRGILAIITGLMAGEKLPSFMFAKSLISNPSTIIPFVFYTLFYGPFPEELGWRGYALDRLQMNWRPLTSSIILGLMWGLWHLPMFFMIGTYQNAELSIGSMRFWLNFCFSIVALSIFMTWVYNNTGGSTLSAIIIHFMGNLTGEIINLPDQMEYYKAIWTIVAAVYIILHWKHKGSSCSILH